MVPGNAFGLNKDGITDSYLNWYDFDARNFDPQLCRWLSPDPANQHPSPYLAMSNNPVSFLDPDGLTDINHYEAPLLLGPAYEGRGYWGRGHMEDPDGHGGRLLSESLVYDQTYACRVESEMRAMMGRMEASLAAFENGCANFELWCVAVSNDQYQKEVNENAKAATEQAPASEDTGSDPNEGGETDTSLLAIANSGS